MMEYNLEVDQTLFNSDPCVCENMKGDSTRNHKTNDKGESTFGKCLSYGEFHSRNSCASRDAKRFKCGKIRHVQSVCRTTVHFASSSTIPSDRFGCS